MGRSERARRTNWVCDAGKEATGSLLVLIFFFVALSGVGNVLLLLFLLLVRHGEW